jgi:hypothetical protein
MSIDLRIFNPSNYPRKGHVTLPWRPEEEAFTGISGDELELWDESGQSLPVQFDRIDPCDPSRNVLAFSLLSEVPPGDEHYSVPGAFVRVSRRVPEPPSSEAVPETRTHIELSNSRVTVSLCLAPTQPYSGRDWFAGSADSFRLDNREMLDVFRSRYGSIGHDPEKRFMQIDKVQIVSPPWTDEPYQEFHLHKQSYRLQSLCSGPVRVSAALASEPFTFEKVDFTTGQPTALTCQLCRVISLYQGFTYVIEETFVRATHGGRSSRLRFAARYFANIDMGHDPRIYRFSGIPDWFAVGYPYGYPEADHPGYGFATDAHVEFLDHPHPDCPDEATAERTYSWGLGPRRQTRCLHIFMHGNPAGFDGQTGHLWYVQVYKPLTAQLSKGD